MKNNDLIKCPKCQSTQISDGKKGFSGGKAVAGAVLTGGIGILAGTIGSNKTVLTCLSCGKKFKPGEDFDKAKAKRIADQKYQKQLEKKPMYWIFLILMFSPFIWLLVKCS